MIPAQMPILGRILIGKEDFIRGLTRNSRQQVAATSRIHNRPKDLPYPNGAKCSSVRVGGYGCLKCVLLGNRRVAIGCGPRQRSKARQTRQATAR